MKPLIVVAFLLLQAATVPRNAGIQGSVKAAAGGGLPNARVELFAGPDTPVVARTDGAGRYAFGSLQAGAYRLRVTRDGYLRQEFGARALDAPGLPVKLAAGQRVADMDFILTPAPTLEGIVADDHGEPLPDVLVQALQPGYDPRGNPLFVPRFFALTDDFGRYRLFWVDPADYVVSATATPEIAEILGAPPNPNRSRAPQGFVPTYQNDVTDPTGIKPLTVETGAELTGLDFYLVRNPHVTIGGHVRIPEGRKAKDVTVSLMPFVRVTAGPLRRLQAKEEGTFEIKGVTPGKYLAIARLATGERGVLAVEVRNEEIHGLEISLVPPISVNGQVYLDSTSAIDTRLMRIGLTALEIDQAPPTPAEIQANGKFTLAGVQTGSYLLDVSGLPGNVYLAAARIGETDILENGVGIIGESLPSPLEILLRLDGGTLSGVVNGTDGKALNGAQVVLVPDADRRRRPDQYRTAFADERGAFTLRGIPPGEYTIYAWQRLEPNAYMNAEFISRFAEAATPVRVGPGANPAIDLRAIP